MSNINSVIRLGENHLRNPSSTRGYTRWLVAAGLCATLAFLVLGRSDRDAASPPPPTSFTIYVLGGSTAAGEPYAPRIDLGQIVSRLFDGEIDGRRVAVKNFGRPGQPAAGALDDAKRIASAGHSPKSALVILYPGNNEFLRFDSVPDLEHPERNAFRESTVSATELSSVATNYETALGKIFTTLGEAGVPVVVSTAAINLRDWEPNRSVVADASNEPRIDALLEAAAAAASRGDYERAAASSESAIAIEPTHALAHFRAGQYAFALGHVETALAHFRTAVDEDGNRQRETSELGAALRRAARTHSIPVIDAQAALAALSEGGIPGYDFFWDNCHPTLAGYARIAEALADAIERLLGTKRAHEHVDDDMLQALVGNDATFMRDVYHGRGQYCYGASALTLNPGPRLDRAQLYLDRAAAYGENAGVSCSRAVLAALRGDREGSLALWRSAWAIDAETARSRAESRNVAQIMKRVGVDNLVATLTLDNVGLQH